MQTTTERLLRALEPFFGLRQTLPARSIQAFLLVAQWPGENITDYARRAGMSHSSMGRNLADLGQRNRAKQKGYGLLVDRPNPENISETLYFLSRKGEALLERVLNIVEERDGNQAALKTGLEDQRAGSQI